MKRLHADDSADSRVRVGNRQALQRFISRTPLSSYKEAGFWRFRRHFYENHARPPFPCIARRDVASGTGKPVENAYIESFNGRLRDE